MLHPIIQYYPEEKLVGRLARAIDVPEGVIAVVQKNGQTEILPAGRHQVRSLWKGIIGGPPPFAWLVYTADGEPIAFHLVFANLLDADDQLIFMDMLVAAQVEDPERLWRTLNPGFEPLTKSDLERLLAEKLAGRIRTLVKKYPLQNLIHLPEAQDAVQRGLIQSLRAVLQEWGMSLQGVAHLGFQKAADAITLERQAQEIRRTLDDMALQAEIDRMENEAILEHARAEFGLTDAETAELQAQLAQEKSAREALEAFMAERLERMEQAIEARLDALAEEQKKASKVQSGVIPSHKNLERLVVTLRIAFYIIAAITAANAIFYRYLPFLNEYNDHFHLAGSVLGLLLALAALISSWLVDRRRAFQVAQAQQEEQQRLGRQKRERKLARERALRRYFEKRLRQVAENCEETWKRIYQHDIDLATTIRKYCVKPYNALADEVMAAEFATARFFQQNRIDVEELAKLLDLSENLVHNIEQMVQISAAAYRSAMDNNLVDVKKRVDELDQGRLSLKNRFSEREQFLMT